MLRNRVREGQNDEFYVDIVQEEGSTDYVKDGKIYQNFAVKNVMVESQSDLSYLTDYSPGTVAYTAGYEHIWQKSIDDEWVSIV